MAWNDWVTVVFMVAGGFFILAGTVGLLRFPDLWSRLHALTKADNLGLGLLILGLVFQTTVVWEGLKLGVIWALALLAGSTGCYAIGHFHLTHKSGGKAVEPKSEGDDPP